MPAHYSSGASPWRPSSEARSLHWWSEPDLQSLAKALNDALSGWCAAWAIPCEGMRVRCRPAAAQALQDCIVLMAKGTAQAWLSIPEGDGEDLLQILFPGAALRGPLARALADSCREDVQARIATMLGLEWGDTVAAPPPATGLTASGAVDVDLSPLCGRLLIGSDIARRWRKGSRPPTPPAPREPLVEATAALANKPLALSVDLQGCHIGVGALQGLQVGDVVRLDHGLANPAAVRYGGAPLCAAWLGRRGVRKAVELAGRAAPAPGEVAR